MRKKILCSAAVFLFLSIVLSFWIVNASGKKLSFTRISQEEAKEMLQKDDGHVILDVRTEEEYASGHIPGAVCIPNETIYKDRPEQLPDLNQIILVYCRSGNRSKRSARMLYEMGYTNVYEFGGINDWTGETETSETSGVYRSISISLTGLSRQRSAMRTARGKRRATRKSAAAAAMQRP